MKVIDGILYANDGYVLRRISDKIICGNKYALGFIYYLNGTKLRTPLRETAEHFEELPTSIIFLEKQKEYCDFVELLIRDKYSIQQELAIQRQRDTKPEEFDEYFRYCEDCKLRAKQELGLLEPIEDEQ